MHITEFHIKFIHYCEQLIDGDLHIIKIDKNYLCFDVNEAYTIHKLNCDGGIEAEFNTMLRPNAFPDYEIGVFYYPLEPSKNFLQLFYLGKNINETLKVDNDNTFNGFTISKLSKK